MSITTDLKLRLTSVDVVGGLVEFLQFSLWETEMTKDLIPGENTDSPINQTEKTS